MMKYMNLDLKCNLSWRGEIENCWRELPSSDHAELDRIEFNYSKILYNMGVENAQSLVKIAQNTELMKAW